MTNKYYKYYQPNSKDLKDEGGDCVIRAFTKATNTSWVEVFDELVTYARDLQSMPNSKLVYTAYLENHNFVYSGISNKRGSKRPTVKEFAKSHKEGTYVLVLANHLVCVSDGAYYDTWDCEDKCLYGYWEGPKAS